MGVLLALFEAGVAPPDRLIGVSVGALNAVVMAAHPSLAGAHMLREIWLSKPAADVFRGHALSLLMTRVRTQGVSILPASNMTRVIDRSVQLTGFQAFEQLNVPLQVVATNLHAGTSRVFDSGPLRSALQASTAIPGVFPPVDIDGHAHMDGGIIDNLPISLAVDGGAREVLAISLMAGSELDRLPGNWAELMARTLQLALHHRALSDFDRLKRRARLLLLCPVLRPEQGLDMQRSHVEEMMEGARQSTARFLKDPGRALFRKSAVHYLNAGKPLAT